MKEAYRFDEPCLEFFFKDDANHDPQVGRQRPTMWPFHTLSLHMHLMALPHVHISR